MSTAHAQLPRRWLPPETARIRNVTVQYETWEGLKVQPCLIFDMSTYRVEVPHNLMQRKVLL